MLEQRPAPAPPFPSPNLHPVAFAHSCPAGRDPLSLLVSTDPGGAVLHLTAVPPHGRKPPVGVDFRVVSEQQLQVGG